MHTKKFFLLYKMDALIKHLTNEIHAGSTTRTNVSSSVSAK